jgi:hypothetical protein
MKLCPKTHTLQCHCNYQFWKLSLNSTLINGHLTTTIWRNNISSTNLGYGDQDNKEKYKILLLQSQQVNVDADTLSGQYED